MEKKEVGDYVPYLSEISRRREPSALRSLYPLTQIPGMISLGGGLPSPEYFPLESLTYTLKDGTIVQVKGSDMKLALQYSGSYGIGRLVEWLVALQKHVHAPPRDDDKWQVMVTTGSQEGLYMAFDMLTEPGDYVLLEDPAYSGALGALKPRGCNLVGIPTDGEGLIPHEMEAILASWPADKPRPKVLYTVPTGQNPSGSTLSLERRKQVYALARRFDLIILEDDPYYYLQFGEPVPSFFSMDADGRVLRFDSFSKIVSSGLRMGFASGPAPLVERIQLHSQVSSLHSSGLSQIILLTLLETWGMDGFKKHLQVVQTGYKKRRDMFLGYAEKYLKDMAEWTVPSAGMFVWFKVIGVESTEELIKKKAFEKKVLLVPGVAFSPSGSGRSCSYVRASFSTATEQQMDEAMKRFAEVLTEERAAQAGTKTA